MAEAQPPDQGRGQRLHRRGIDLETDPAQRGHRAAHRGRGQRNQVRHAAVHHQPARPHHPRGGVRRLQRPDGRGAILPARDGQLDREERELRPLDQQADPGYGAVEGDA